MKFGYILLILDKVELKNETCTFDLDHSHLKLTSQNTKIGNNGNNGNNGSEFLKI